MLFDTLVVVVTLAGTLGNMESLQTISMEWDDIHTFTG